MRERPRPHLLAGHLCSLVPSLTDASHPPLLRAALIALGPCKNGNLSVFFSCLDAWPVGSVQRRLADIDEVLRMITKHLGPKTNVTVKVPHEQFAGGFTLRASLPNKPAAICYGNRAQALLQLGNNEEALKSAKKVLSPHNPRISSLRESHREFEVQCEF